MIHIEIRVNQKFKDLIPPLTVDERKQLEENILKDGIRDPLVVWNGTLVDGHNRYEIARKHGLEYRVVEKEFRDEDEATLWIIDNQFGRRNLPDVDRIMLSQKRSGVLAEMAKKRQKEAGGDKKSDEAKTGFIKNDKSDFNKEKEALDGKRGFEDKTGHNTTQTPAPINRALAAEEPKKQHKPAPTSAPAPKPKPVHVQAEIAKMAGVSQGKVAQFEQIQKKKPELIKEIRKGNMTIGGAYQMVRKEEKKKEVQERIEKHATEQTGVIDIQNVDRKYNIIYADPPWKYWESGNKNQSLHYTTMTIDDICNLPIKDIADNDCVLFLWVTYPILQEAFRVIESWGFKYSTAAFVWVKKNKQKDTPFIGCGAWTRANSELCLLATKGKVMRLDASVSQIVESPIEDHSKKPDIVRELITKLVGELPRVELFCRHPADGWDVWGNEA